MRRHPDHLSAQLDSDLSLVLSELLILFLSLGPSRLLSLPSHTKLVSLLACFHVGQLGLVLLLRNYISLFLEAIKLSLRGLHRDKFFSEQVLSIDKEGLRLANNSRDVLASSLRVLLQLNLRVNLAIDFLIKLQVL